MQLIKSHHRKLVCLESKKKKIGRQNERDHVFLRFEALVLKLSFEDGGEDQQLIISKYIINLDLSFRLSFKIIYALILKHA